MRWLTVWVPLKEPSRTRNPRCDRRCCHWRGCSGERERAALVGRGSLGVGLLWKTWWFQEANVADPIPQTHCNWPWSPWDAQQVLPEHGAFCPNSHSVLSPCLQLRSWCWNFSGSLDFIHSAAKIRPPVLPRGTLFWFDTQRMHF